MATWTFTDVTAAADLSAAIDVDSLVVTQRAYAEVTTLKATIRNESGSIADPIDHEVLLDDAGSKVFAGIVRVRRKTDTGVSGQLKFEIECQDFTTLLGDDVVPFGSGVRTTTESDKARITWLFSTFGTRGIAIGASVVQLRATMPSAQDFGGKNLHECLTMIAAVTGGSFYVDFDKVLHYFNSETNAASFGLSDNPNGSTTFGYEDFAEASDTNDFVNEVHVRYATGSTIRYLGGSPPAAGTKRAAVIDDTSIPDLATAQARGDSLLATYGVTKKPSKLRTYKAGLRAGQYVQVTHAGWGISAVSYRIAGLTASPDTKDRIAFDVDFGSGPVELGSLISGALGNIASTNAVAQGLAGQITAIADLSVGGANLIPNSSFEDGSSWIVGAQWAIGFAPSGGQLPFAGADTARAALSAQTAGDLVTPKINVDRNDEYVVSWWRFVRSRSSGTFRVFVKEYNAANTLLATTNVDVTAADTAWTRGVLRFAPAAALNPTKIAWQTTTAKVEIGFNSAGAAATLTVDVDGVQLERGEALTAYAPSPGEILAGTIGTTQIADDAITTPKLVAFAVTAAKIAAGTITANEIAAGTITTNLLAAGAISLYDENGATILTPAGFAGSWFDFVTLGLYNARFSMGTTNVALSGRTADCPYWAFSPSSGTIKLQSVGSKRCAEFRWTGLSTQGIQSDKVPIAPKAIVELGWVHEFVWVAGALTIQPYIYWFKEDGSASATPQTAMAGETVGISTAMAMGPPDAAIAPADAAFAAVGFGVTEGTTHSASNIVRIFSVSLVTKPSSIAPQQRYSDAAVTYHNMGVAGTKNNVDPGGLGTDTVSLIQLDASGACTITGFMPPRYGKRLIQVMNMSAFSYTLKDDSTLSNTSRRIWTPGSVDFVCRPYGGWFMYYDDVTSRWKIVAA